MDVHEAIRVGNALLASAGAAALLGIALLGIARLRFATGSPRCPRCRFDLRGLQDPAAPCSECGDTHIAHRATPRARRVLERAAIALACISIAALAGLFAHPGSRARAVSWVLPWQETSRIPVGDAVAVIESLRFPHPYPDDGVRERVRVRSARGTVTVGEYSVVRANDLSLGDGIPRILVDLSSGGNGGLGGTWMVTVAPDAPPVAVLLAERAEAASWGEIVEQHEARERAALGRALTRSNAPTGIGLVIPSFRTQDFSARIFAPRMDVTAAWTGSAWSVGCAVCADPISDELYAELAAAVRARMTRMASEEGGETDSRLSGPMQIEPLLAGIAALAQAGHRDRAEQLARDLFMPNLAGAITDCATPEKFANAWAEIFDAEGIQRAGHTPSSRSALSAARIGDASNPSSASGSATSSH